MKKKDIIFFLMILGFSGMLKSQFATHKMLHIGYVYQNQSFAELGGRLLFLNNDDMIYRFGVAAMMGSTNSDFAIMPKIQGDILINFEKNTDIRHSYYFLAGAEATTKYFAPKAGVTLLGLIDFTVGYAFPLDNKGLNNKILKGLNINFTVNMPVVMLRDLIK